MCISLRLLQPELEALWSRLDTILYNWIHSDTKPQDQSWQERSTSWNSQPWPVTGEATSSWRVFGTDDIHEKMGSRMDGKRSSFCGSSSLIIILSRIYPLARIYKDYIIDFLPIKHSSWRFVDLWIILSKHFCFSAGLFHYEAAAALRKHWILWFCGCQHIHWWSMVRKC